MFVGVKRRRNGEWLKALHPWCGYEWLRALRSVRRIHTGASTRAQASWGHASWGHASWGHARWDEMGSMHAR